MIISCQQFRVVDAGLTRNVKLDTGKCASQTRWYGVFWSVKYWLGKHLAGHLGYMGILASILLPASSPEGNY